MGTLVTSSKPTAIQYAEVLEVGTGVEELKRGDKVFIESWGISIISYENENYYFVNTKNGSIVAKVDENN